MKIRVINKELPLFNQTLKIKSINFDMVVAEMDYEETVLDMEDVELVSENEYENLIVNHKDVLKIKLNREISPAMYVALIDCVEEKIGGKLTALEVLRDEYKISKRGIFEKNIVLVLNNSIALQATVVGMKYSDEFSITFKDIALQDFIEGCNENIRHLKKEIDEKEKNVDRYRNILKAVIKNSITSEDNNSCKLISG